MKKLMYIPLVIATAMTFVGCASTGGSNGENPVTQWQEERTPTKFTSTCKVPEVATLITAASIVPNAVYLKIANGVDQASAKNEGRRIYLGIENDVKAGTITREDAIAALTPEDNKVYKTYVKYVVKEDFSGTYALIKQLAEQVAAEGPKIAALFVAAKENSAFKALAGLELMRATKELTTDVNMIKGQIADSITGIGLWRGLIDQDKKAQAFMKSYNAK